MKTEYKRREPARNNIWQRLRIARAAFLSSILVLIGILLIMLNGWLGKLDLGDWSWLRALPLGELGGTFFGAGLIQTLFEYNFRNDQTEETVERFRQTITEQAPAMRDAVIQGFAIDPQDLE